MGALSVVICAVLSSIFLKETLTMFGWLGCSLCIVSRSPYSFLSFRRAVMGVGADEARRGGKGRVRPDVQC